MRIRRLSLSASLALALLAACGGGSTDPNVPTTGSLAVSVSGLPSAAAADITVSGPGGYSQQVDASTTLTSLTPGSYTVTAAGVASGSDNYVPSPTSQAVAVSSGSAATATVAYQTGTGTLNVSILGLPGGTDAAVTVTGPGGYSRPVTATETVTGLMAGQYTVTALPVTDGSEQYSPAPPSQTVAVTGAAATATVNYSTGGSAGFNLRVDGLYMVQSVQKYDRSVPLVKDRDALLRIFVTANQVNTAAPAVRVRLYSNGTLVATETVAAPGAVTPLGPDESSLSSTWNLDIDQSFVQPNLSVLVDVDPDNLIAEGNETDNQFPASGTPAALDVQTTDPFAVRFVPVITKGDGRQGNVHAGNRADFLDVAMRMQPLASYDADVRAPYTTSTNLPLQSDNANGAWGMVLSEIAALPAAGGGRYYYGVVNPNYSSGVAGMGYIGGLGVAIGWDKLPSGSAVAAHEWGHNWGRQHAPCGGAGNPDASYPYAGGEIGVVGYDLVGGELKPADSHDLMGYCNDEWISDYTYKAVMNFRSSEAIRLDGLGDAMQSGLLVWGRIVNGQVVLEPAFRVAARPRLPSRPGPYRLEGRAANGSRVFGLDFTPVEVADDPQGSKHFAFVVPMRQEKAAQIASLELNSAGVYTSMRQAGVDPVNVEVTKGAAGRVALRWDERKAPMIMVRDPATGEVLSFARGGNAEVVTDRDDLALTISDRVRSRDLRVRAKAR